MKLFCRLTVQHTRICMHIYYMLEVMCQHKVRIHTQQRDCMQFSYVKTHAEWLIFNALYAWHTYTFRPGPSATATTTTGKKNKRAPATAAQRAYRE